MLFNLNQTTYIVSQKKKKTIYVDKNSSNLLFLNSYNVTLISFCALQFSLELFTESELNYYMTAY